MQSGKTRGTNILAREIGFTREALNCSSLRGKLEYSKTTHEFIRVLEGSTRYFVNFGVTGTVYKFDRNSLNNFKLQ